MKGRKKQVLTKNTTNVDYKKVSDFFHTQLKTHLKDVFIQKTTDGWNLFNRFKNTKESPKNTNGVTCKRCQLLI